MIHARATETTLGDHSPMEYRYELDFGEPGSTHNVVPGFNAGHKYTGVGNYTVTLRVTNGPSVVTAATATVTVSSGSYDNVVYVRPDGDNSKDGSTDALAVQTLGKALWKANQLGDRTRILLAQGTTIDTGPRLEGSYNDWSYIYKDDIYIGAYDSTYHAGTDNPTVTTHSNFGLSQSILYFNSSSNVNDSA